jgi:hypothetical protein
MLCRLIVWFDRCRRFGGICRRLQARRVLFTKYNLSYPGRLILLNRCSLCASNVRDWFVLWELNVCERLSFVMLLTNSRVFFAKQLTFDEYCVHAEGAERVVSSTSALLSGDLSRKCIRKFSCPPGKFLSIRLPQNKWGGASRRTSTAVHVITCDTAC